MTDLDLFEWLSDELWNVAEVAEAEVAELESACNLQGLAVAYTQF